MHSGSVRRSVAAFQHEGKRHAGGIEETPGQVSEIFRQNLHIADRVIGQDVLAGGYDDKIGIHAGYCRQEHLFKHER